MGDDPANRESLFVADSDITSLPCFAADTLFAVKAPPGTTLEVGDPGAISFSRALTRYKSAPIAWTVRADRSTATGL
jgi:hypothetical protein